MRAGAGATIAAPQQADGNKAVEPSPSGFRKDFVLIVCPGMGTIDDLLIERVSTPLTGWLQHRLGVSQWRASIESLNGSTVFYVAGVALELGEPGPL